MKELIKIQSELKAPKNQYNQFGGYNYRSCEDILEAVKPLLEETKTALIISDRTINVGTKNYIESTARLYNEEGAVIAEGIGLAREAEAQKGMNDSQLTGSTSSYARKYALNGLFCIDDTKDSDATNKHGKDGDRKPPQSPKSSPDNQNSNLFTHKGTVSKVDVKTGNKNGKPWTKWGIKIGDDIYGTFNEKIGKRAVELEGQPAKITFKQEGKFLTCYSIEENIPE